jgi:hypothetical protein
MLSSLFKEMIMLQIILTMDPATGRGLYDDEAESLGSYRSLTDAEESLGDLLRFCTIHSQKNDVHQIELLAYPT